MPEKMYHLFNITSNPRRTGGVGIGVVVDPYKNEGKDLRVCYGAKSPSVVYIFAII